LWLEHDAVRRLTSRVLTLLLLAGSCSSKCKTEPPSAPTGCWEHPLSPSDALDCSTDDDREPNGSVVIAHKLRDTSCEVKRFSGRIADDVDVFRAEGKACAPDSLPRANLQANDKDVRLCLFAACAHGTTGFTGCTGDKSSNGDAVTWNHLPEGAQGCCRVGSGNLTAEVHCASEYAPLGKAPEWHAYYVVDRLEDSSCADYSVTYGF
jgi:hypothetical protein